MKYADYEETEEITDLSTVSQRVAELQEYWLKRCIRSVIPVNVWKKGDRQVARYLERHGYLVNTDHSMEEFKFEFKKKDRTLSTLTIKLKTDE